jgi:hypothetical protein
VGATRFAGREATPGDRAKGIAAEWVNGIRAVAWPLAEAGGVRPAVQRQTQFGFAGHAPAVARGLGRPQRQPAHRDWRKFTLVGAGQSA